MNTQTDLVPVSLAYVIIRYLEQFRLDHESRLRIERTVTDSSMTPSDIMTLLDGVTSTSQTTNRAIVDRLKERITEFTNSCPICMEEETSGIHIMGCCGYCMCDVCFHSQRDNRCAFCRTAIQTHVLRRDVDPVVGGEEEAPVASPFFLPASNAIAFDPAAMRRNTQVVNLTRTLHHVRALGCMRIVVIVERLAYHRELTLDIPALARCTDIAITRVDNVIRGKGTQFAKIKAEFDSPDPSPMALMSYGIDERFLVGTDLAHTDCLVTVGTIHTSILTQALGRVLRPRRERDNTQPIRMFKIYTGSYHDDGVVVA